MTKKVKKEAEVANAEEEQFGVKLLVNDKNEIVIMITIGFDKSIAQQMLDAINAICSDKVFVSREKRDGEGRTIVDVIIVLDEEADLDNINKICRKFMDMLHSTFLRMQLENVLGISNEYANDTAKKLKGLLE